MWPKEIIPDESAVFMRIHKVYLNRRSDVPPNAFRDHNGAMSVDWDKYSTPSQTRARARNPADNAVIGMRVEAIRLIDGLSVEHDPTEEGTLDRQRRPLAANRAHSNVLGEKQTEQRVKLSRIWQWAIRLTDPVGW